MTNIEEFEKEMDDKGYRKLWVKKETWDRLIVLLKEKKIQLHTVSEEDILNKVINTLQVQ